MTVVMIGVFDSGHGGLNFLKALVERFPGQALVYLGDHRNAPYGNRPSEEPICSCSFRHTDPGQQQEPFRKWSYS